MTLNVTSGEISDKEVQKYVDRGNRMFNRMLDGLDIEVLNDAEVKITYHVLSAHPTEKIQRKDNNAHGD